MLLFLFISIMDGYQLYQHYTQAGQRAYRDSDAWCYGQLLHRAFYLVGITRLFDLLEEAQATDKRLGLVYTNGSADGPLMPSDVELIDQAPPVVAAGYALRDQPLVGPHNYSWLFS